MFVDSSRTRSWSRRDLVEAITAWARARGAARLYLWVTSTNHPAIALYRRCGFRPTGDVRPVAHTPPFQSCAWSATCNDGPNRPEAAVSPRSPAGTPFPLDAAGGLGDRLSSPTCPSGRRCSSASSTSCTGRAFPTRTSARIPRPGCRGSASTRRPRPSRSTHIFVAGARLGSTGRRAPARRLPDRGAVPQSWCALATYLAVAPRAAGAAWRRASSAMR